MNWLTKQLQKLLIGIAFIFFESFKRASPYYDAALDAVKEASIITVQRTVETVENLAQQFGVEGIVVDGNLTPQELGEIIRKIVLFYLQTRFPGAPERYLNRAIEIAYGVIKP